MQRFAIFLTILLFVCLTTGQPPTIPLTVTGTVRINGEFAPVGTLVTAKMDGETEDYELTEPGRYVLSVSSIPGDHGREVKFYVDGIPMDQTAEWRAGGLVNLDFDVFIPSEEESTTSTSSSTTLPQTSSTTTPGTSTTSTSTIVETTTSTVMAATSTVLTTIKPKADSGDGFSPKLFLLAILGIMLLLLLAVLAAMMKRH